RLRARGAEGWPRRLRGLPWRGGAGAVEPGERRWEATARGMSACEKCWRDAHFGPDGSDGVADRYRELMDERKATPCTPEEQAGPDATDCSACGRRTRHQYTSECMACGRGAK